MDLYKLIEIIVFLKLNFDNIETFSFDYSLRTFRYTVEQLNNCLFL